MVEIRPKEYRMHQKNELITINFMFNIEIKRGDLIMKDLRIMNFAFL